MQIKLAVEGLAHWTVLPRRERLPYTTSTLPGLRKSISAQIKCTIGDGEDGDGEDGDGDGDGDMNGTDKEGEKQC